MPRSLGMLAFLFLLTGPVLAEKNETILRLYTARHYASDKAHYELFTNKTGIRIEALEGDANQLLERLKHEGAATKADVFVANDAGVITRAALAGVLASVDSRRLNEVIPLHDRAKDGSWYAFSKRARVLIYNTVKGAPAGISRYEDLAKKEYKGKICTRSSTNLYTQSLLASLIAANGKEATLNWVKGYVANLKHPPSGNDVMLIKDVVRGECEMALVNTYYLAHFKKNHSVKKADAVSVLFLNQDDRGAHVNSTGAGVVKGSKNAAAAIAFLEFLASPQGQEIFARQNYEYPVVKGVELPDVLKKFGDFKADTLDLAELGRLNAEAVILSDEGGLR